MSRAPAEPGEAKSLRISEIFTSLQGEGASAGKPCLFVRLALCNLHCRWCDTKYTWDFKQYRYEDEVQERAVSTVAELMAEAPAKRVVITGGEPLLQQAALVETLARVPADLLVEIETNGTLRPAQPLLERVDQWNVSPKLSSAGDPEYLRIKRDVLDEFRGGGRAFLKLVVNGERDLAEADALVAELGWPPDRVILMPEARTRGELAERSPPVAAASVARGVGFSTRLQLLLFDGRRGT